MKIVQTNSHKCEVHYIYTKYSNTMRIFISTTPLHLRSHYSIMSLCISLYTKHSTLTLHTKHIV